MKTSTLTLLLIFLANPVLSFKDPLVNLVHSFYFSKLEQCSSVSLIFYGNHAGTSNSQIITLATTVFEKPVTFEILYRESKTSAISSTPRLSSGCFVIFINVDDPETFPMSSLEIFEQKYLLAYFIFCFAKSEPTMTEQLVEFVKSTRKILRPVFLITSDLSLQGYIKEGPSNTKLRKFYYFNEDSLGEKGFSIFEDRTVNMEREPLVGLVCGICVPEETPDGEPMTKDFIVNTIYTLAKILNATLELQAVLAELTGDHFQDGVWDEWVNPLLDGSGTISTLLRPTPGFGSVTYFSSFKVFLHIGFLTALPKKATFNNLIRLAQPFTISVWLFTLTSFFAVFIAFTCVLYFESKISTQKRERWAWGDYTAHNWRKVPEHSPISTMFTIFQPILEQGVPGKSILRTSLLWSSRWIMGIWLLLLIVLSCAYKTKMLEMVVLPREIIPPQTFHELAASTYKIGALLYEMAEPAFQSLNNSFGNSILTRVQQFDYMQPDCFQMILHQEMVCMGPSTFFEFFGPVFLTDVYKKSLSLSSKQTMFPNLVYTGISKLHPNLVGTINFVFGSLTSGGIDYHSAVAMRLDKEIEGQKFARSHMKKLKHYAGKSDDFNSNEQNGSTEAPVIF